MKLFKGIITDIDPIDQPADSMRYAKNVLLNKKQGVLANEKGNVSMDYTFEIDAKIIGSCAFGSDELFLFIVTNVTSRIVRINTVTNTTTVIIDSPLLAFSKDYPISAEFTIDPAGDILLYWTDGLNPPRLLNLSHIPTLTVDNISSINLFPSFDTQPQFTLDSVNYSGGSLITGVYYIGISYYIDDFVESNVSIISNKIVITDDNDHLTLDGDIAGNLTSKSISCTISNLDTSYKYFRIYLIRKQNGQFVDIRALKKYNLSETVSLLITGAESYDESSIDKILINTASYSTAKTLVKVDDKLYMGNLSRKEEFDFQPYVNNIVIKPVYEVLWGGLSSFKSPLTIHNKSGFKSDEVYAFYISFLMKDGTESKAYHIPGRLSDNEKNDIPTTDSDYAILKSITGTNEPKYYEFRDTSNNGTRMQYHENQNETYPNTDSFLVRDINGTVIGDFRGQNVRHHRFPSIINFTDVTNQTHFQNFWTTYIYNIQLENVFIPNAIKDEVIGIRFHYAERTTVNKTVIAQPHVILYREDKSLLEVRLGRATQSDITSFFLTRKFLHGYDFNLLRQQTSLGSVTHMVIKSGWKQYYNRNSGSGVLLLGSSVPVNILNTNFFLDTKFIRKIKSIGYIPPNIQQVDTGSIGMSKNINNEGNASCIAIELTTEVLSSAELWLLGDGTNVVYNFFVDLKSYKTDVYQGYDQQNLITIGQTTDLINHTSDGIPGPNQFKTDVFGGGDTYYGATTLNVGEPSGDYRYALPLIGESSDNVFYRHQGTTWSERYFPKSSIDDVLKPEGTTKEQRKSIDNWYGYTIDYSDVNNIKPAFTQENRASSFYPTRIIRSQSDSLTFGAFRKFLENDFLDLPKHQLAIIRLDRLSNKLLIHTKVNLLSTVGREQLTLGDVRAFIGSGDIFAVNPTEIITAASGYGGIADYRHAVNTPIGYFFIDVTSNQIFHLADGLTEISSINIQEDLRNFFTKGSTGPQYTRIGYDPEYRRILITHVNNTNKKTLSYLPELKIWASYHDYFPETYLFTRMQMLTEGINNVTGLKSLWIHHRGPAGKFYNEQFNTELDVVVNNESEFIFESFSTTHILKDNTTQIFNPLTEFRVYTDWQDSGVIAFKNNPYPVGNTRMKSDKWITNGFRDCKGADGILNPSRPWYEKRLISGRYAILKLIYDNSYDLSLYSIDFNISKQ